VVDGDLDVAGAAGEPQVAVEALDGFDAEPQLLPRFVADVRTSPLLVNSRMPRPQELRHSNAMPSASSPNGSSRDRLKDWMGVRQSTAMVVGRRTCRRGHRETNWPMASRSSRVSSRKCLADW
jgi:hypothetical protein